MKKLALAVLLVVAGCQRQVKVTSAPASSTTTSTNASGAASAREAVQMFLASGKAQDLQAMANIWGTAAGPARSTIEHDELEKRLIYMMRCLRHDSYAILSEQQATGGERVFGVEVRRGTLTPRANFTSTLGTDGRWYLREFELPNLNPICTSK